MYVLRVVRSRIASTFVSALFAAILVVHAAAGDSSPKASKSVPVPSSTAPALAALPSDRPAEILPVEKVSPGMKGYGFSDLGAGQGIQRFEVEVIGVLKRFAPKQDLILAKVSGAGLEHSGIIAGMSGSPIYVEGKLLGALAYGWPFSKDPICGITPIQSMLDIRHAPPAPPVPIAGASGSAAELIASFADRKFTGALDALLAPLKQSAASGLAALPIPVSFTGAPAGGGWLFDRVAAAAGWVSAPAGSSGAAGVGGPNAGVRPGSPISTVLLSGDMLLAATGTVTWVDGDSVLAFGHPFLSMGPIEMPMARADVLTVLPSVYRSFKFSDTGAVIGSVTQDRSTGILGTFGTRAAMVPITVRISSDELPAQTYKFEAVHNPMLTPVLAAIAIDNVLTTLEKRSGERTLVWKSAIKTPGRDVRWDTVFSGLSGAGRGGDLARAPRELPDGQRIPGPLHPRRGRRDPALRQAAERAHRERRGGQGEIPRGRARADPRRRRRLPRRLAARHARPRRSEGHAARAAHRFRRRRQCGDRL